MKNNKIKQPVNLILLFIVIIIFAGCPASKRDELEFYRSKVDSLRIAVNNFVVDYNRLKHQSYLEEQPFLIASLYQRYEPLFNQEDINLINNLLKLEQRPERIERLERLKIFIYEKIVEKYTAGLHDRIEITKYYINYPSKIGNGKFDDLELVLAHEPNPKKRKNLYNSNQRFFEELIRVNLKLLNERKAFIIDSLRFNSYNQFASMVRQEDITKFFQLVNDFISTTNDFYYQQLYELLRQRNLSQNKLYACDIPFLIRDQKINKYFKHDSVKSIFLNFYYNLGIKIDSLPNLKVIFVQPERKKIKELTKLKTAGFEVSIPDDNYLYINQSSGSENYERIFSESGKLLPSLFTKEKFFEFNYFGGDIIPLTFKALFSNILDESEFLNTNFFNSKSLTSEFIKLRAFKKLYIIRKLCADFITERLLIDSIQTNQDSLAQIYSSILGYNLTNGDKFRLFNSINDYYFEADLIKSFFNEAMIKTKIREKYGKSWFKNPNLHSYLMKFFERGRFLTKDKFLAEIGYYDLDPRFFFNEIISIREKSKAIRQR